MTRNIHQASAIRMLFFVTLFFASSCGIMCFANDGSNIESKKINDKKEVRVDAATLYDLHKPLSEENNFDLEKIALLLPYIFKDKKEEHAYFEDISSFPPGASNSDIRALDLVRLEERLIIHATRAYEREEASRVQRALELSIEVALLPISLTPPDTIFAGGEDEASGILMCPLILLPTFNNVRLLKEWSNSIAKSSETNAELIAPVQEQIEVLQQIQRLFRDRFRELRKKDLLEAAEALQNCRETKMGIQRELPILKDKLTKVIIKVMEGEKVLAK